MWERTGKLMPEEPLSNLGKTYPRLRKMLKGKIGSQGMGRYLNEGEFRDEIEYAFAQYVYNERPLMLDKEQIERSKGEYGGLYGVKGGVIYRGGRIEDKRFLEDLRRIERKGGTGTIFMDLKSFSHSKRQARAFADFVKTYDPMIGAIERQEALERGSAGRYGSYVLTVKADSEVIVINTENPHIGVRSEDELIVYGDVQIVAIEIIEPLTRENWKRETIGRWRTLREMENTAFLAAWLKYHKINPWVHGLREWLEDRIRDIEDFKFLILRLRRDPLFTLQPEALITYINEHPLMIQIEEEVGITQDEGGIEVGLALEGEQLGMSLGLEFYKKMIRRKGREALIRVLGKVTKDARQIVHVLRDERIARQKYVDITAPLTSYIKGLVLIGKEAQGAKEVLLGPLEEVTESIKEIARLPLTSSNIRYQMKITEILYKAFRGIDIEVVRGMESEFKMKESQKLTKGMKFFAKKMYNKFSGRALNKYKKEQMVIIRETLPQLIKIMGMF